MKQKILDILVKASCIILGLTFVLSGFVKAVDPLGTQYKFHDYLDYLSLSQYFPDAILLIGAVALSTLELTMGILMLLAIGRKLLSKVALLFMIVMTLLTVWIYFTNPVQDCGCFGDAIVLTNGQTLAKNLVLLLCAALFAWAPLRVNRMLGLGNQILAVQICVIACVALSLWCIYDLPLLDFRPYHVGADIKKGMIIPDDAEQPEYETTFILEKDGKQQEFSLDDYPDSTWTFVDSKTKTVKEGYVPPIHDFTITTMDGDDITEQVLDDKGYTLLLVAPYLESADDQNFGTIDQLYEYAEDSNMKFYCLTASNESGISTWKNLTGAEYPFCQTDGTTLKTIVRSNPGLVLISNGVILGKWSHNRLPSPEDLEKIKK